MSNQARYLCLTLMLLANAGCGRAAVEARPADQDSAGAQAQRPDAPVVQVQQPVPPETSKTETDLQGNTAGLLYKGKSVSAWVALLRGQDRKGREDAAEALARMGASSVSAVAESLNDKEAAVRRAAAETLGKIGREAQPTVPQLLDAMTKDKDGSVTASAALALFRVSPTHVKGVVDVLIDIVRNGESEHRLAAAKALGEIGPEAKPAAGWLADMMRPSSGPDRQTAAEALKKIDPQQAKTALERVQRADEAWKLVLEKAPVAQQTTSSAPGTSRTEGEAGTASKQDQEDAIARIKKLRGVVRFHEDDPRKPEAVELDGIKLTEADLEKVSVLKPLKMLVLRGGAFPHSALKHLRTLSRLDYLDLMDNGLVDEDLKHLDDMTALKVLSIGLNPRLTDAGLKHLKKLTNLEDLNLASAKITDDAIQDLTRFSRLKYLNLAGTRVTRRGVDRLESALPKVGIISTARE